MCSSTIANLVNGRVDGVVDWSMCERVDDTADGRIKYGYQESVN